MDRKTEGLWAFLAIIGGLVCVVCYHFGWWAGADTGSSDLFWMGVFFIALGAFGALRAAHERDE